MGGRTILQPCVHGRNEPVATARNRFDKPRSVGRVAERVAQPVDHRVQTVLEVDERVARPEPLPEFLPRNEVPRAFEQKGEGPQRLFLKTDPLACLAELARAQMRSNTPNVMMGGAGVEGSGIGTPKGPATCSGSEPITRREGAVTYF